MGIETSRTSYAPRTMSFALDLPFSGVGTISYK